MGNFSEFRLVVPNKENEDAAYFEDMVKSIVGQDADVQVRFLDEIPLLSSGKCKVIINEWKKD